MECPICCETYNNSTRTQVKCEYGTCANEMCKTCLRTCLKGTPNDAHCFECKNPFTDKYLVTQLGRTWVLTDYRAHRREMLFQREGIAKLPDSMAAAILKKKLKNEEDLIRIHRIEIQNLKKKESEINARINACYSRMQGIRQGNNSAAKEEEKTVFIMNCPADECRGYLSSAYKCGLCELYTCAKCFELVGHTRHDETHICKEENIQSADMIRKDTKPCPSCGIRTHKIEGCDQMFCTCCKKAWSWQSGKIDTTGRIHNPHYYQWQRELAEKQGVAMAREPGDMVCGGFLNYQEMRTQIFNRTHLITHELRLDISNIHRTINHLTNVELEGVRTKVRNLSNYEELRIAYINNEISKEKMAVGIYRNDNSRKKYTEYLHVYELLSTVGIDMFRSWANSQKKGEEFVAEVLQGMVDYGRLREYANEQFANISRTYNQRVPQIDVSWTVKTRKFALLKKGKAEASVVPDQSLEMASDEEEEESKKVIVV